jgi:putative hydrolase of the HAD superfamily
MREITPDLVEIRKASFRQALIDIGRPNELLAERMSEVYFDNRWAKSDLYEDVRPAMETLATKYHLGVISNGNSYPERFGLTDLISSCVYAQDHGGVNKPDPKLFQIAIDEAACNPHELLHVGDSLSSDVGGAKNFGALAAWINRDGAKSSAKYKPDLEIVSLSELVEIL